MPLAFPLPPDCENTGIRRRPYGAYLIFYRIDDSRITILRIVHSARNYPAVLFPGD
ncbi:MAG: type II toxin-antitoxin system RelE/ParE family toxin [Acetobacteraceae bacterium]